MASIAGGASVAAVTRPPPALQKLLVATALASGLLAACDGCRGKRPEQRAAARQPVLQCEAAADCADDNPCSTADCVLGKCVATPAAKGTSCDNGDVCDGVARCDGGGRCVPGTPPLLDDRNACTTDSCDPAHGVRHEPVHIDDGDVCTTDACDPRTGAITHVSVDIDDGNDCTLDTCDPATGPRHQQPSSFHTCSPGCG